jgi:hypothetical protein
MFLIPYYKTVIRTPLTIKAAKEIVARDVEIQRGPYLFHFVFHERKPRATFIGNVSDRGFRLRTYTTSTTGHGGTSPLKIIGSFLPIMSGTDVIVRVVPSVFSFTFWGLLIALPIWLMAYVGSLRERLLCLSISLGILLVCTCVVYFISLREQKKYVQAIARALGMHIKSKLPA